MAINRYATINRYTAVAPVFVDGDANAEVISYAKTRRGAERIYRRYFAGTGEDRTVHARKACPDRGKDGPVDGWIPDFDD